MHGEDAVALDQLEARNEILACIEIPASVEADCHEFLHDSGIELLTLYRDLPHIGLHLREKSAVDKLQVRRRMAT